jgi:Flp pilus assembly pilin Flp
VPEGCARATKNSRIGPSNGFRSAAYEYELAGDSANLTTGVDVTGNRVGDVARPLRNSGFEVPMLERTLARLRALLLRDEIGQDIIEYALLASLIAVVAIEVLRIGGTEVADIWSYIATGIDVVP